MKNRIKSIFFLLCIGSFARISAELDFDINTTIEKGLNIYEPNKIIQREPLSLDAAATQWAHGLVSQLSIPERVALAYFSLTAEIGPNARQTGKPAVERILKQMTSGGIPANEKYVRELAKYWGASLPWGWTTFMDIPGIGGAISLAQGAQQALTTAQYAKELSWSAVKDFEWKASQSQEVTFGRNKQLTNTFFNKLAESIKLDLKSPDFAQNIFIYFKRPVPNVNWQDIEPQLQSTIASTIRSVYEDAGLQAPDNAPDMAKQFIQSYRSDLASAFRQVQGQMTKGAAPFEPAKKRVVQEARALEGSFAQDRRNIKLALDYVNQRPAGLTRDQLNKMQQSIIDWQDQLNDNTPLDQTQRYNLDRIIAILDAQLRKAKVAEQAKGRLGQWQRTPARRLQEEEEWEEEEEFEPTPRKTQTAVRRTAAAPTKPATPTRRAAMADDVKKFVDRFMHTVPQTANRNKVRQKLAAGLEKMPIQYPQGMLLEHRKKAYKAARIQSGLDYFDTEWWPEE